MPVHASDDHLKILFFSDSHLGFDHPGKPRTDRRRRGPDFYYNYMEVLAKAERDDIQMVIHGGDLFFRSRIGAALAGQAIEPLMRLADRGIEIIIVPGNHERSDIPFGLLACHPRIHIFRKPGCFLFQIGGLNVSVCGFPFVRSGIRNKFMGLLEMTGYRRNPSDAHILCFHQAVDGAVVGVQDFMFRSHPDVIDTRQIPEDIHLVLSGHIHRAQVITRYLSGQVMNSPVIYPGSIERTAFAERNETKGFFTIDLSRGPDISWTFHPLPAREMIVMDIDISALTPSGFRSAFRELLEAWPADSVVRLRLISDDAGCFKKVDLRSLQGLIPQTMNVEWRFISKEQGRPDVPPEN